MKRSPLRRETPLRRKGYMRRKRPRRIDLMTEEDRLYLDFVHRRPCVGKRLLVGHVCVGRVEQSHERNMTGLGLKAPVKRSVAMCGQLADEWEEHRGPFRRWTKEARRVWMGAAIEEENAAFYKERGR